MIAPGDAATNLQIDDAGGKSIAPHCFPQHDVQSGGGHRHGNPQFREGALQTLHMPIPIYQTTVLHSNDLINPVSKLIASVFNMNGCRIMGQILPVYIGYAAHNILPNGSNIWD